MATVTKPIALDESFNTTEQASRNIADVLAEGIGNLVSAVSRIAPKTTYDLDDLGDVDIESPTNGDVLKYNSSTQKWENGQGGGSGDSVAWTQIQQSGTKIAEIEINGVTTDVYAPTGGGGFSALIVITAATGQTVTVSKGGDTYTAVETSSGTYEVSVDSMGTWTVTDGTNTDTVAVSQQTTYYVTLSSVPDGRTVLPTDDVSIWLACGGRSEAYTTLAEVLNDSVCLSALIADSNAIDYLARSTTFAKSEALVPKMTSNTTPSGECFGSSVNSSTYDYYKAFDGDNSTLWAPSTGDTPQSIGYKSASAICVKSLKIYPYIYNGTTPSIATFQLQGSNDNSTWIDIGNVKTIDSVGEKEFTYDSNNTSYLYHQVKVLSKNVSGGCNVYSLQFYTEEGLTDNATAMSYIGLNNYASNTLLADSTWCSAIWASAYKESVLNVKVPVMTSDNTPSGQCFASSENPGREAFHAFDGVSTEIWNSTQTSAPVYLGYDFGDNVRIYVAEANFQYQNFVSSTTYKYQTSSDNSTYNDVSDSVTASGGVTTATFLTPTNDRYKRIYVTAQNTSSTYKGQCNMLQFYGRADI